MSRIIETRVPDIGNFKNVPVIDVCVKPGDAVKAEDALITIESDKATMDIPAPSGGIVREIKVKTGDRVTEGDLVAIIEASDEAAQSESDAKGPSVSKEKEPASTSGSGSSISSTSTPSPSASPASSMSSSQTASARPAASAPGAQTPPAHPPGSVLSTGAGAHASPSVRLYARELGVDLISVSPSGPHGRILKEDVTTYVRGVMKSGGPSAGGPLNLLPWPSVDFQKFGPVEIRPFSKIKKISGQNLSRNWVVIPHVVYHEDADITELEAFRVQMNKENEGNGPKITMLSFLLKACEIALKKFPEFNSSVDGDNLVLKHYYHIAFAADTPNGLVVPVIKNVDQKSISELATETSTLAKKAREGKLSPAEMSGACFTISSLGGIGGTSFSPIINAPEVAILGASKAVMKPVWNGSAFLPRLILPLSLSADHRVIDGALATHFNAFVAQLLSDMRRLVL